MPVRLWAVFCPGEMFILVFICTLLVSAHHEGCSGEEQEDGGEAGCGAHRSMHEAALLPRCSFPQQGKFHHMWRIIFPVASQRQGKIMTCCAACGLHAGKVHCMWCIFFPAASQQLCKILTCCAAWGSCDGPQIFKRHATAQNKTGHPSVVAND